MSVTAVGLRAADKKTWRAMKKAWDALAKAEAEPTDELIAFFGEEGPSEQNAVVVPIDFEEPTDPDGIFDLVRIDLKALPKDLTHILVRVSY